MHGAIKVNGIWCVCSMNFLNLCAMPLDPARDPNYAVGRHRGLAQLVEHRSPKPRVVGSSPSAPANTDSAIVCRKKIHKNFPEIRCASVIMQMVQ